MTVENVEMEVPFQLSMDELRDLRDLFNDGDAMARAVRRVIDSGDEVCRFGSAITA